MELKQKKYIVQPSILKDAFVPISGSKNAVLPILVAAILCSDVVHLSNVPLDAIDIQYMIETLEFFNIRVTRTGDADLAIDCARMVNTPVPSNITNKTRYSILLLAALGSRFNRYSMGYPGGCNIACDRPINLHIESLRKIGFSISIKPNSIDVEIREKLKATSIDLPFPSVSATENIILAAVLTRGITTIKNSAIEPEVVDLCVFLNKCGAEISGVGERIVTIKGVDYLRGAEHRIIPDRIEIGTFISLAAVGHVKLTLYPVIPHHMHSIFTTFKEMGIRFEESDQHLLVDATHALTPIEIVSSPFPGFPSDMAPIISAACLAIRGISTITDTVYPMRYSHIDEFCKLEAQAIFQNGTVIICGGLKLKGTKVRAQNIRAGAAAVIASLLADGLSEITDVYQIERGYERFPEKLRAIGVNLQIIT